MNSRIRKVTVVQKDGAGVTRASVIHDRGRTKVKTSIRWLAIPEAMALQGLDAGAAMFESMRTSHQRSNQKRSGGWLLDMGPNMLKAATKGRKRIKLTRLFLAK